MRARFYSRTARTQGTFCFAFYKKRAARKPFRTACAEWEGLDDPAQNDGINADVTKCPPLAADDLGSKSQCRGDAAGEANVTYQRSGVQFVFRPSALGGPGKYYFAARSYVFVEEGRPPPGDFCCPDTTGRAKLVVKQPVRR